MPNPRWDPIGGPIRGLRLPFQAWEALRQEGITNQIASLTKNLKLTYKDFFVI